MKKLSRFFQTVIISSLFVSVQVSCDKVEQPFESDLNVIRMMLTSQDWGSDTCYVYGHKNPDTDAVCSSLAYAGLMRTLGYNCVAKVCSETNDETAYISRIFDFELPELKSSVEPGTRLIATDHEEFAQSVDGAQECRILQIIDHHEEGDMVTPYTFLYRGDVGSTCTLVWELYDLSDVPLNDAMAKILLAGLISDTCNLTTNSTTEEDVIVWETLCTQLKLSTDQVEEIYKGMEASISGSITNDSPDAFGHEMCLMSAGGSAFSGNTTGFSGSIRLTQTGRRINPSTKTTFRLIKDGKVMDGRSHFQRGVSLSQLLPDLFSFNLYLHLMGILRL